MQTILDQLVSKVSDIYCHSDDVCYVSTCSLNCLIHNMHIHIKKENHMMIFGYLLLLEDMAKQNNPVEAH